MQVNNIAQTYVLYCILDDPTSNTNFNIPNDQCVLKHSAGNFKFTPESGTTHEGHDYEEKVTAFLSLKACQNMDNFWISSNMKGMEPLDDVIICTKKSGKNMAYLCQIKHSQKCAPLPGKELDEAESELSMRKFYEKFELSNDSKRSIKENINRRIPEEYSPVDIFKIVIFTNRTILAKDVMFKLVDDQIFNADSGKVYSLNCEEFSNVDPEFSSFLKYVNVYANQGSISDIERNVQNCMQQILGNISIGEHSSTNYMKYIQIWIQITQAKIGLDYKYVKALVELSFLLSHTLEVDSITENVEDNVPGHYLWEDITNKSLFIKKSYLTFVAQMISNKLHHFMPQTPSQIGNILFSSKNYDDQKPTIKQKYILSCFHGSSPFILDIEQFPNLPKLEFVHYIPTGHLDNLKNLNQISDNTFSKLLNERITLNCGRTIALRDMFKDSLKIILPKLTVTDALSLINGEDNSHYIENEILFKRKLKPILLKIEALGISNVVNDLFVLNILNFNKHNVITMLGINEDDVCVGNNYEDKFKYVFVNEDDEFQNFIKIRSRNVHFLKIINNNSRFIEWVGTSGIVENIKQFREEMPNSVTFENNLINLKDIHNYFQQSFVIISAEPGKGKSSAMKQIALSTPLNIWVLRVNLVEEQIYFKTLNTNVLKDSETYLEHFYKNENSFLKELYNIKIKHKELLILLDGFDEIAPTFAITVTEIITRMRNDGFKIILTTRTVLEKQIENTFNTFSISLCAFNRVEEENYLKEYFVSNKCEDVLNRVNVRALLDQIDSQNSFKFCSIPLHINLVADMLEKHPDNIKSGNVNLLQVYEQYIHDKINIYENKIQSNISCTQTIIEYHKYFAIKTLFSHTKPYKYLKKSIDCALSSFNKWLQNAGEKNGFLISYVDEIFVHRTIAEYYVANWLGDIININNDKDLLPGEKTFSLEILKSEIFNKEFDNLRLFFNLVINKNYNLHERIIYKDYNYVKKLIEGNTSEVYKLNKYNQTLLHTLISSCNINEKSYNLNKDLVQILYLLFINHSNILQSRDFCGITARDYAKIRVSNSLLKIKLIPIQNHGKEINYYVSYNEPFNMIEFLFAQLDANTNIIDILSVLPKAKEINFESLVTLTENEYFSEVADLLKTPQGINAVDENNNNLIHWAIENNKTPLISQLLLQYKYFLNLFSARNNNGDTPILIAIQLGNLNIIKNLVAKLPTLTREDQDVAIIYAVIGNYLPVIEYLLTSQYEILNFLFQSTYSYLNLLPIYIAFKQGNFSILAHLLKKYIKPEHNDSALHYASTYKNKFIIESVIKLRENHNSVPSDINIPKEVIEWLQEIPDLNAKDNSGVTPLIRAVKKDNKDVADYLISIGADLYCRDNKEYTCLHHAVQSGSLETLKMLCRKMNDKITKNSLGAIPLHTTAQFRKLETSKFLVRDVKCLDNEDTCAPIGEHTNSIEYCMRYNDLNVKDSLGRTPLHLTAEFGKLEASKFLISKGADVHFLDNQGGTCLHIASIRGHINSIKYFLQYNEVNAKNSSGWTPLHYTAYFGKLEASKLLVSKGADIKFLDNEGGTCLHSASMGGHTNSIEYFLKYHDVNVKNSLGRTPLHITAEFGKLEASKFLASKGADVKLLGNTGDTSLHRASVGGHTNLIEYFLQYQDVNVKNSSGWTPLHYTAYFGKLEASKFLVSQGANVKFLNNSGDTCLHSAAIRGHTNSMEYFLQYHEVNVKNALGQTPLYLTAEFGKLEASKFLINKGADIKCLDNVVRERLQHLLKDT